MAKVTMPQLGETVADGTVTKWFKAVGDVVAKGDTLFEVSTDKVDTEIPSQFDGVLSSILVKEGETVDVGTVLAIIGDDEAQGASPAAAPAPAREEARTRPARVTSDAPLSPVVRRLLAEHGLDAAQVVATGPQGRLTRDDVLAHVAAASASVAAAPDATGESLSPVVRKLLRENGLSASDVTGTGPRGRLTRKDVEAAIAAGAPRRGGDEVIPFTKIRRLTAEHMVRSKATSAHTLMAREIDYERVDALRRRVGASFKEAEGFSLTYLPFNALAVVEALREFPHLNASVGEDELVVHHDINLGIAVDVEGAGLIVPVVRDAPAHSLTQMARAVRDLATRARTKKLTVDDTAKGTFTITNPGPFGTLMTGAIINQPQVAILSTDGVTRKPVVVTDANGGESIAIHSVGLVALTFDHRVIDGAYAARFLARLAEILSSRDWSAEL
ncbi:MAG TPA: dihydrolipoamide acetyltransferase family protein [Acidimicrobiales bacterium]|nr:dihydrolipoamide acetyltransferase family protein [Acidimicrobiales bacterium]